MADIKTRDAVKGTIKTIDKAAIATERMKSAYSKYDSSFISRSSHGMPRSFGTFLHFGQHRIIHLRPSPDIFRRMLLLNCAVPPRMLTNQ